MRLLAGDVGGTKTILALVENDRVLRRHTYPSGDFPALEPMIETFLGDDRGTVARACFGVAGPVVDDLCRATNLPWVIDARELERRLGFSRARLVNDFHALAIGIGALGPAEFAVLNEAPSDPRGPWVVIGAGTGLGEAIVVRGPAGFEVISSEGGHTDFAPRNELEIELLRFLLKRHKRVSYERVVSGPGLVALYEFMRERNDPPESAAVRAEMEQAPDDVAAIVSSHALKGDDPLCEKTLELFVSIYGAEAGNLALKVVARGGVYVAGGIAPKILPKLLDGTFRAAFVNKGRLSPLVEATPVKVVLNPDVGLLGAAAIAATLAL
ncbi:MAG: glucokinase [Myxococcales bacterium]